MAERTGAWTLADQSLRGGIRRACGKTSSTTALPAIAALLTLSTPAQSLGAEAGQSNTTGNVEEVVVTGIRQSLESAQEIKQNAEQIVESVTAQDIGALPDRSV